MKLLQSVGAAVLSMSLFAGCAVELDSTRSELDNDPFYEATGCVISSSTLISLDEWPVDEIVVGQIIYTQDQILDLIAKGPADPHLNALLEFSAAINSLASGLELPESLLDELDDAEGWLADPDRDDAFIPPVINTDFRRRLDLSNIRSDATCFTEQDIASSLGDEGHTDRREGLQDRDNGND